MHASCRVIKAVLNVSAISIKHGQQPRKVFKNVRGIAILMKNARISWFAAAFYGVTEVLSKSVLT